VSISLVFSEQFSNATSIVWISRGEVGNSPLLYELLGVLEVSCNVLDQTSPLLLGQNLTVEDAGLLGQTTCMTLTTAWMSDEVLHNIMCK
jgi:hypothetical protein